MKKKILLLLFMAVMGITAQAYNEENKEIAAGLRAKLATVKSPKDSVKILYDIFDLSSRDDYRSLTKQIFETAGRAGDTESQLDILRQVTSVISSEEEHDGILETLQGMKPSKERDETILFIEMKQVASRARNLTEAERQQEITKLITELENKRLNRDKYSKMLTLFKVVEYLRTDASIEMLEQYDDMLVKMFNDEGFELYALGNLICSEAANTYTAAGDQKKAVEADRKLLEIIAGLEKKYAEMGRRYRNYDVSKFISYRRMLRNYEGLRPGEAQELYAKIGELRKSHWDVARDIEQNPMTKAFYNMATGSYHEAIPYLRLLLERDKSIPLQKRTYELLIKAADKIGDEATAASAREGYQNILDEYERLNSVENYKALRIRYEVKALQEQNTALELENKEKDLKAARTLMLVIILLFVGLAIAFVVSIYNWGRYKKHTNSLTTIAEHMTHERNRIRHNVFYDYADDEPEGALSDRQRWEEKLKQGRKSGKDLSVLMVEIILNDLMHIAMLGKGNRDMHIHEVSFDSVMRRASSLASERNLNLHQVSIIYPEDDFRITTDRDALAHIVGFLLHSTAANVPLENTVSLTYERVHGQIRFIFTAEHYYNISDESVVFEPILTIDEIIKLPTSGMDIDRLIALLLVSDIKYDKSYTSGTRFIFTTPDNLKIKG